MPMNRSEARVVDPVLSQVALGYRNARYVGLSLMPIVDCAKSGVRLIKFGKEAFVKYNMRRAPGADVAEVQYGYASDPIALVQDSLKAKVPREWLRDADGIPTVDLEKTAVNNVMNSMHLGLEIEIAEIATNPANYGAANKVTVTSGDYWNDPESDLKGQMDTYKEAVRMQIGIDPNTLVLNPKDFNSAKRHPQVLEQVKYTTSNSVTEEMLANFFEVEKVEVGRAVWTTDESSPLQDCWQHSVLAYVPPEGERNMAVPSYGYTFVLNGHPLVEEGYFKKGNKSWLYGTEFERAPYQTGMSAGFLIQNATN